VRHVFLALLAARPTHGYRLQRLVQERFGPVSLLRSGQVYTTLARLEREGLVESRGVEQARRPNKRIYASTPAGRVELRRWMDSAAPPLLPRRELLMKFVVADVTGIADPRALIARQRREYEQAIERLLEADQPWSASPEHLLLRESAVLHLQADITWLDRCEERLFGKVDRDDAGEISP
jgi:DNA-binding PadR family transcriptional regulator